MERVRVIDELHFSQHLAALPFSAPVEKRIMGCEADASYEHDE